MSIALQSIIVLNISKRWYFFGDHFMHCIERYCKVHSFIHPLSSYYAFMNFSFNTLYLIKTLSRCIVFYPKVEEVIKVLWQLAPLKSIVGLTSNVQVIYTFRHFCCSLWLLVIWNCRNCCIGCGFISQNEHPKLLICYGIYSVDTPSLHITFTSIRTNPTSPTYAMNVFTLQVLRIHMGWIYGRWKERIRWA